MASLIKAILALHHRVIAPSPAGGEPHPLLADPASPLTLNASVRPWIHGDRAHPRRAGVNAFGFSGISAHAILEEHPATADGVTPGCQPRWETEAILIGAPDRDAWLERARRLRDWLGRGANASVPLKDIAATLSMDPAAGPFRVGIVASSAADLAERLGGLIERLEDPDCRSIRDARGVYYRAEPESWAWWCLPGRGSCRPGTRRRPSIHFPQVRTLDTSGLDSRRAASAFPAPPCSRAGTRMRATPPSCRSERRSTWSSRPSGPCISC